MIISCLREHRRRELLLIQNVLQLPPLDDAAEIAQVALSCEPKVSLRGLVDCDTTHESHRHDARQALLGSVVSGQAKQQVSLHVRPLMLENAVHHGVAHRAVAPALVMTENAVLLRTESLDRSL